MTSDDGTSALTPRPSLFCVLARPHLPFLFFFNDTATTEIYTLSLHDALPIWTGSAVVGSLRHRALGSDQRAGFRRRHRPQDAGLLHAWRRARTSNVEPCRLARRYHEASERAQPVNLSNRQYAPPRDRRPNPQYRGAEPHPTSALRRLRRARADESHLLRRLRR